MSPESSVQTQPLRRSVHEDPTTRISVYATTPRLLLGRRLTVCRLLVKRGRIDPMDISCRLAISSGGGSQGAHQSLASPNAWTPAMGGSSGRVWMVDEIVELLA